MTSFVAVFRTAGMRLLLTAGWVSRTLSISIEMGTIVTGGFLIKLSGRHCWTILGFDSEILLYR